MRLRVQTDPFTTVLLAALGLAPLACGGAFASNTGGGGDSGSGGQSGDGSAGSGQPGAGGDIVGTGGASSGVGGDFVPGTGGSVGAGGASTTGAGGGTIRPFPCVPTDGLSSGGYETCANHLVHRPSKQTCPSSLPRPVVLAMDGGVQDAGTGGCQSDSDCTAAPHGYCGYVENFGGPLMLGPRCSYGCVQDTECGMNQICVCGSPAGHCEGASCSVDAQCGPGLVCGSYAPNPGCPGEAFACQTPVDQCATDADCKTTGHCTYQQGHRVCSPIMCAVGRPFLVEGSARMAPRATDAAWQVTGARPNVACLSLDGRARLAEEWTLVGLMEHASIAAFARFTLQLMSLGAPADLVERSNAAISDETLHARLAFSIASGYAGRPVGPGRLDVRGALDGGSLREILINVIREGCIGETVAAVEAAEAFEHATDPVVRAALERIARDELGHADLAWQFVRWAVETGGEPMRDVARAELEVARVSSIASPGPCTDADERGLLAGGILTPAMKREVRATTIERVVLVCARALLGTTRQVSGEVGAPRHGRETSTPII